MGGTDRFAGLAEFVAARGDELLARATLLTGSRAAGEDLLQASLERLMRHWRRMQGEPEGYLRRTMYHRATLTAPLHSRGKGTSRSTSGATAVAGPRCSTAPSPNGAEPPGVPDTADAVALRRTLVAALAGLPPRQRAVLVLRYWEELSEAEAAAVLGCSVGTVKSTASRGLARLREVSAFADDARTSPTNATPTNATPTNGAPR